MTKIAVFDVPLLSNKADLGKFQYTPWWTYQEFYFIKNWKDSTAAISRYRVKLKNTHFFYFIFFLSFYPLKIATLIDLDIMNCVVSHIKPFLRSCSIHLHSLIPPKNIYSAILKAFPERYHFFHSFTPGPLIRNCGVEP